jgi:hypothetical protein
MKSQFETEAEAREAGVLAQKQMPQGWELETAEHKIPMDGGGFYPPWTFFLERSMVRVFPVGAGWCALCGVETEDGIAGGPWTTGEAWDHPGKAAMHEAEAMNRYVQDHIDAFKTVAQSMIGLEEYETVEHIPDNGVEIEIDQETFSP